MIYKSATALYLDGLLPWVKVLAAILLPFEPYNPKGCGTEGLCSKVLNKKNNENEG